MVDSVLHSLPLRSRRMVAKVLRRETQNMAARANDAFYLRHPEWQVRFGEAGLRRGVEDAAHHLSFLAGALEAGQAAAFVDYVAWLVEVLAARGIGSAMVVESLELCGDEALRVAGEAGHAPLSELLRAGIARATATPSSAEVAVASPAPLPFESAKSPFTQSILRGDRHGAVGIAREALRLAVHPTDVYVGLFQQSLEDVGRRWQSNTISVAQEHMATATVQFVLAQLYSSMERPSHSRGTALVTGVEGELHQIGSNLVADALELDGWRVRFLGTNMPHDGIIDVAREMKANLVCISATMLFNLDPVVRLVATLRAAEDMVVPRILVGGRAFSSAPNLWREIEADGFAIDLRGACAVARAE